MLNKRIPGVENAPYSGILALGLGISIAVLLIASPFLKSGPWMTLTAVAADDGWEVSDEAAQKAHDHSLEEGDHSHGEEGHVHGEEGDAHEDHANEEGVVEVPADLRSALGLASGPVQNGEFVTTLDLYGWVAPRPGDTTELSAPIAGIVEEVLVHPGDMVESGSPLISLKVPAALEWQKAILTSVNDQAQLGASRSLLASEGHAEVVRLLGELRVAAAEKARLEEDLAMMEQAGSNAVPRRDINSKRGELKSAAAQLEAKRALALAYEMNPQFVAEVETGKTSIQVPDDALPPVIRREIGQTVFKIKGAVNDEQIAIQNLLGLGFNQSLAESLRKGNAEAVTDKLTLRAKKGGLVEEVLANQQAALNPGDPILRAVDYRKVHVEAEVPEVEIANVLNRASDEILIRVTGLANKAIQGKVVYFDTTVHPDVRKAHLVVEVENLDGLPLRDHMAVSVGIPLAIRRGALSVPKESLLTDGFEKIVFTEVGGHFHRTPVKTGIENLDSVEVLEGLSADARVVVSGARSLWLALSIPKGGGDPHAGHSH